MIMKTISRLTFTFLFIGLGTAAMAQPGGQRMTLEERAKTQTEALVKELSLTKEQTAKVDSINLRYARLSQEVISNASGDMAAMQRAMTENREKQTAATKAALTAEQVTKYEKWLADQPERVVGAAGGAVGVPRGGGGNR